MWCGEAKQFYGAYLYLYLRLYFVFVFFQILRLAMGGDGCCVEAKRFDGAYSARPIFACLPAVTHFVQSHHIHFRGVLGGDSGWYIEDGPQA